MKIDLKTGLLDEAVYLPSAHHDIRPEGMSIDTIVIHNISLPPNEFGGGYVQQFFCDRLDFTVHPYFQSISKLKVASHLFIERGGKVFQFVPFDKRAWHAGESSYKGRSGFNDFSIGIELEGSDQVAFEDIQYEKLKKIISALKSVYLLKDENIVGHSDIAPGRKTDPGPWFEWEKIKKLEGMEK